MADLLEHITPHPHMPARWIEGYNTAIDIANQYIAQLAARTPQVADLHTRLDAIESLLRELSAEECVMQLRYLSWEDCLTRYPIHPSLWCVTCKAKQILGALWKNVAGVG